MITLKDYNATLLFFPMIGLLVLPRSDKMSMSSLRYLANHKVPFDGY